MATTATLRARTGERRRGAGRGVIVCGRNCGSQRSTRGRSTCGRIVPLADGFSSASSAARSSLLGRAGGDGSSSVKAAGPFAVSAGGENAGGDDVDRRPLAEGGVDGAGAGVATGTVPREGKSAAVSGGGWGSLNFSTSDALSIRGPVPGMPSGGVVTSTGDGRCCGGGSGNVNLKPAGSASPNPISGPASSDWSIGCSSASGITSVAGSGSLKAKPAGSGSGLRAGGGSASVGSGSGNP